ncbi:hypothetical protein HBH64_111370 [Parastagonospora nodorum]|nr:hypothetical protein HBH52_072950 [Parastagonospora nodorum]KAH4045681.1 hypothetical protein HBH49_193930 [Parastagonospora nodorum]KAH4182012.1 hypothetical protein HBH42_227380 [Parastagonospora nodorum]KAH4302436.1 hypothetical protein HBI02_142070 [Parastagonospora nodorum]KAH4305589.1 hypothetical protein HBI01_066450 [Parastagonospora nodorum]
MHAFQWPCSSRLSLIADGYRVVAGGRRHSPALCKLPLTCSGISWTARGHGTALALISRLLRRRILHPGTLPNIANLSPRRGKLTITGLLPYPLGLPRLIASLPRSISSWLPHAQGSLHTTQAVTITRRITSDVVSRLRTHRRGPTASHRPGFSPIRTGPRPSSICYAAPVELAARRSARQPRAQASSDNRTSTCL